MEFRFTTNKQYFQRDEEKRIREFIALKVTCKDTWYNAAGESRQVIRVDLPEGCIWPGMTVYSNPLPDGSKRYHTPTAVVPGPKGRVIFCDAEGKQYTTDTDEWMKWGENAQINEYKKPEPTEADKKKAELRVSMMKRSVGAGAGDDFTKAGKWTPAKQQK